MSDDFSIRRPTSIDAVFGTSEITVIRSPKNPVLYLDGVGKQPGTPEKVESVAAPAYDSGKIASIVRAYLNW